MAKQQASEIAQLTGIVERGFKAVAEDIAEIRSSMATKDDIADLKTEMIDQFEHVDAQFRAADERPRDIASEVAVIHRRIDSLVEQGASNAGFAKEIDHLLSRVAEIEKHLGLTKKAAA